MSDGAIGPGEFASSPCFAHELESGYGTTPGADDVRRWRKVERERLIADRLAVRPADRARLAHEIACELNLLVEVGSGTIVGAYWPFRGEPDLRAWLGTVIERGGKAALPVVAAKARPLIFREWTPRTVMTRGVWNIPIPARTEPFTPNIVIAPLVGYDPGCYRLGYGGGFFDRTLAAVATRPLVIGVGGPWAAIPTIHRQPHDIPMDVIVTGAGAVRWREPA